MDHLAPPLQGTVDRPSSVEAGRLASGVVGALRRIHPRLAASLQDDIDLARTTGMAPLVILGGLALAALGVIVIGVMRPGVTYLYSESLPLVAFALIIGLISPFLGGIVAISLAVLDLVAFAGGVNVLPSQALLPVAVIGRLIAFWLLWLLIVEAPLLVRQLASGTYARVSNPIVAAIAAAGGAAVLAWIWTLAFPVLIRPYWTWSGMEPHWIPIQPVQREGLILIVAAALGAAAVAFTRFRLSGPWDTTAFVAVLSAADRMSVDRLIPRLARRAVVLITLGGLITSILDALILAAALVVGLLLATFLASLSPVASLISRIPLAIRAAAAFALTFGVALLILGATYEAAADSGLFGSLLFPVVLAVAAGIVIYDVLVGTAPLRLDSASVGVVALGILVLVFGTEFASPAVVSADNCAGIRDCWDTVTSAAAAAGGAAAAGAGAGLRWIAGANRPYSNYQFRSTTDGVRG